MKTFSTVAAMALVCTASGAALAEDMEKGVNAFRACYGSDIPPGMTGAPELTIEVVVDSQPEHKAMGTGKVTWGSVQGFAPIETEISGPWYYMCTMDACSIRFDFSGEGLDGMLVATNWGSPGTFKYSFNDGDPVEQKAMVCN
ncbi:MULTISPECIES: DUF1842 domain-containing protein [Marichromatium]|uniref:Uncharacterized protein n=1 Tax=Marichromatium gracile TaxID=1048 RepID=A0A4V6P4Q2_MARGR|nr:MULTISPECIES: DUF1842 domain-containing protein [Marichromatium]MBK1710164.1 hypothetical protein [Marichromatium gracile]RNE88645.1 hypothetical protein EBL84_15330 [Marichromatium sp. AB31]TCW34970.1 hypothetical protein EDC29_108134 [Marichromatium gracile]